MTMPLSNNGYEVESNHLNAVPWGRIRYPIHQRGCIICVPYAERESCTRPFVAANATFGSAVVNVIRDAIPPRKEHEAAAHYDFLTIHAELFA